MQVKSSEREKAVSSPMMTLKPSIQRTLPEMSVTSLLLRERMLFSGERVLVSAVRWRSEN